MKPSFLVETCLLTHGLDSVTQEDMARAWAGVPAAFCWLEEGAVTIGDLERFLLFRRRREMTRVSLDNFQHMVQRRAAGPLTASGTMAVCRDRGIPLAVSCGIGGIGDIPGEQLCSDLPALAQLPVTLLATSPKDMLDLPATFQWLRQNGVTLAGYETRQCSGYVFSGPPLPLDEQLDLHRPLRPGRMLILNPIPGARRLGNPDLLRQAVAAGKAAAQRGEHFHPAANRALDTLSDGLSSRMQLQAIVENARLAARLQFAPPAAKGRQ